MMAKALITDLAGPDLRDDEARWLEEANPLGIILFERNIRTPQQVSQLTNDFRSCVGRDDAPVLVDQEGGRVARLRPPHWWGGIAPGRIAELLDDQAEEAAFLASRTMANDMMACGISIDCAPGLDLHLPGADNVIGDRSLGADPGRVTMLGRASVEGFLTGGILPIIKHMPGYGRVRSDPHFAMPVIDDDRETLDAADFQPFKALRDQGWGMTAHAIYSAIDADLPATLSPIVIAEIIRGDIGFDGVLVTDALDMEALSGSHAERAAKCLEAGCDLAMHCNASLDIRREVGDVVPELSAEALRRLAVAETHRRAPDTDFDREAALERLRELIGEAVN